MAYHRFKVVLVKIVIADVQLVVKVVQLGIVALCLLYALRMAAGQVELLVIMEANPVYTAPADCMGKDNTTGGDEQSYFEDCSVCCRPVEIRVLLEGGDRKEDLPKQDLPPPSEPPLLG